MQTLIICTVILVGLWWIRHNQLYMAGQVKSPFFSMGSRGQARRVRVAHRPAPRVKAKASPDQREFRQAMSKITTYTHNAEVSERLLHSTHQANMSKSIGWCAEKVIDDILRDRR